MLNKKIKRDVTSDNSEEECGLLIEQIKCEVCEMNQFKYTCPRCLVKSCSVPCVKKHKMDNDCDGQKDKFLQCKVAKEMNENMFHRDVKFVNESINGINVASKKIYTLNQDEENTKEKKHKKYLKRLVKKFRNVNFKCCPMVLERFKENKSYCDPQNKKFFWSVKFIFMFRAQNKQIEHLFPKVFDDSEETLTSILNHMKSNPQEMSSELLPYANSAEWDRGMKFYYKINSNTNDFTVNKKFTKIDNYYYEECTENLLLKDILDGKDVYEYPEFYIFSLV